ncbi:lysozyme inhibitor LprI family protein [Hahella aquimaris]|uniref:lysozyme inhibitor LprI family protein n=1 Tax=Hahella sp. HNIBRBA332 TaxID=3015983 RepID=UPI00273AB98A|nr:lysozyme inhibitor LprI family protein [Hahella sp. HNIBRBA332]WLQ16604.1 lysozyme inhibitor LprI family protein [Hahella sp. HNIBRBA332]
MKLISKLCRYGFVSIGAAFLFFDGAICAAASFDCAQAASSVETLICEDENLSSLDEQLAAAYKQARELQFGKEIKFSQTLWLKETRNACADVECLRNAYERRIQLLGKLKGMPGLFRARYERQLVGEVDAPEVSDYLEVNSDNGGVLQFAYESNHANGHSCSVEGEALQAKSGVYEYHDLDVGQCLFRIYLEEESLVFEDIDGACRTYYCGARGFIAKDRFAIESPKPLQVLSGEKP